MARLFEQGGDVEPQLTHRVAWGLSGVSTKNSTWQTVVTFLQGTLSFLRPSNNLSDLTDPSAARTNLGITNPDLSAYALKSNVLELNNTVEFSPSAPYNPATAKYVSDFFYSRIKTGSVSIGDFYPGINTVWVPYVMGASSYQVFLNVVSKGISGDDNNMMPLMVKGKTNLGFNIVFEENDSTVSNIDVDWIAIISL